MSGYEQKLFKNTIHSALTNGVRRFSKNILQLTPALLLSLALYTYGNKEFERAQRKPTH